jgi:hypothetical protein
LFFPFLLVAVNHTLHWSLESLNLFLKPFLPLPFFLLHYLFPDLLLTLLQLFSLLFFLILLVLFQLLFLFFIGLNFFFYFAVISIFLLFFLRLLLLVLAHLLSCLLLSP